MIQILVCDKVYVTPEMKRKKRLYKLYFILSVFLVICLSSYYIYAEYDRNKSAQVSQEILESINKELINIGRAMDDGPLDENGGSVRVEDDVIVVVLNDNTTEEIKIDDLLADARQQIEENESNNQQETLVYTASDGTQYYTIGVITIPKIDIKYPILSTWNYELLKIAPCMFYGAEPNQVGNCCIIAHNYRSGNTFFTNLIKVEYQDIIQITDTSGKTVDYIVYDKYTVDPEDTRCTSQKTDGKKEITLITCYNKGTQRTVIKATAAE